MDEELIEPQHNGREHDPDSEPNQEKQIIVQAEIHKESSTPDKKPSDYQTEPNESSSTKKISIIGSYYM